MESSPMGSPLERHAPGVGFTRIESGGGRKAAQLAAMTRLLLSTSSMPPRSVLPSSSRVDATFVAFIISWTDPSRPVRRVHGNSCYLRSTETRSRWSN